MNLNDILRLKHIDPAEVIVMRHRPKEEGLRKALPWLAESQPNVYNGYQQGQGERAEKALLHARYVASFIGTSAKKATFVGLYENRGSKRLTHKQFCRVPANVKLRELGMEGYYVAADRPSILWFDLALTKVYAHWKSRLIVDWPGPERVWWRWAHRNDIPINSILEKTTIDADLEAWDKMDFAWKDLRLIPTSWKAALAEWRAIYLIFDLSDRKGYVGSAYGTDNLLGRWMNYASTGHGGNKLLRKRKPENFRFTILQRVSPDLDAEAVIRLENSWKERLHTRNPLGLNDN